MSPQQVLVVGGGIAGMCAAVELRKRGHPVDLVEQDPNWQAYGAGITLSGPTLRAFTAVGVIDRIMAEGWCADGLDLQLAGDQPIGEIPTPRVGRPDVPGGGGILRPVLARILREATLASGAAVRCGTSFQALVPEADGVRARFTDGREKRYDLVVGADGLQSKVRETLFPDAPTPTYTGQVSWRAEVPRPASRVRAMMALGPGVKAGVNPVSRDQMYLYVTEAREQPQRLSEEELAPALRALLAPFGGAIAEVRDGLGAESHIVYRPFFALLMPRPWHRGRVVIIGDAVHATTPHLASGAGIGVEDALVLAEEMERSVDIPAALDAFTARRFERYRMVVMNSVKLGEVERTGAPKDAHEALMRQTMGALLQPS